MVNNSLKIKKWKSMRSYNALYYFAIPIILFVIAFIGYFLFIQAQEQCKDNLWPIPSPDSIEFGPYYLITDQGPLYVGQTYEHKNEGPWVGNMTLLFIQNKGATLLFKYPKGTGIDYKVLTCKGYLPRIKE